MENNLKRLRAISKMTQSEVAKKLGVSRPTYTTYEIGTRDIPTDILIKLSDIFSTSVDEIINNKKSAFFSVEVTSANFIYFLEKNVHKISDVEDLSKILYKIVKQRYTFEEIVNEQLAANDWVIKMSKWISKKGVPSGIENDLFNECFSFDLLSEKTDKEISYDFVYSFESVLEQSCKKSGVDYPSTKNTYLTKKKNAEKLTDLLKEDKISNDYLGLSKEAAKEYVEAIDSLNILLYNSLIGLKRECSIMKAKVTKRNCIYLSAEQLKGIYEQISKDLLNYFPEEIRLLRSLENQLNSKYDEYQEEFSKNYYPKDVQELVSIYNDMSVNDKTLYLSIGKTIVEQEKKRDDLSYNEYVYPEGYKYPIGFVDAAAARRYYEANAQFAPSSSGEEPTDDEIIQLANELYEEKSIKEGK